MTTGTRSTTEAPKTAAGRKASGGRRSGTPSATTTGRPMRRLVIVESPTKARKIAPYLGNGYVVESSVGHIRDLPRGAADVPAKYKGESWARLGVDVDNEFTPLYIVTSEKKGKVSELRDALKSVDEVLLATDPDREGEAIAWHLLDTLKPKVPVRRMVFHEITEPAIRAAAANLRDLDLDLVDAQETRRILDRLYGYEVSPVLWKKVMPKLSAGRVQSVATRIIVQRERERMQFVSASYWDIAATLDAGADASPRTFAARLVAVDGDRVATGRDFGADGRLRSTSVGGNVRVLDEPSARRLAEALQGRDLTVASVESKPYTRRPYAPFMTSTLQQEAGRKLRFSAERTMRSAQRLYENGYITYMRTDSTTLSESAIQAARAQARELYGDAYVPPTPRQYTRKVKNAQEAHEAIRPSGETFRTPGQIAREVDGDDFRLYELIWQRTVASQMADARGTTVSVRITGTAGTGEECTFAASGRTITFAGFLKAYVETVDDQAGGEADDAESRLPELRRGPGADRRRAERRTATPPTRPPATPRRAWSRRWRSWASGVPPRTRRSSRRSRTAATSGSRAARWCRPGSPSRWSGCSSTTSAGWSTTTSPLRWKTSSTRSPRARTRAPAWLNGFYFGGAQGSEGSVARAGGLKKLVGLEPRGDRRPRDQLDPDVRRRRRAGRALRAVPRAGARRAVRARQPARRPAAGRADGRESPSSCSRPRRRGARSGSTPLTGHEIVAKDGRYGPYVTEVLPDDDAAAKKKAKPAHELAVQGHDGGDGDAGAGRPAAVAAACRRHGPGERRGDHRAERPLRAVSEEGHRLAVAGPARSGCSPSPSTRRSRSTGSPSSGVGAPRPRRRRCGSWAATPRPASRW